MDTDARPRRWLPAALLPALRPALPALAISVLSAAASGIAALAALWCVVRLLVQPEVPQAAWACGLWLASAGLAALASWLAHDAEGRFEARLRRQVARHLLRLPASTLSRYSGERLRRLVAEDIAALHHLLAHLPGEIVTFGIVPLATIGLLLAAAGPLALLALVPGLFAAFCYLVLIPRLAARHGAERNDVMGEIVEAVDDYARGIRVSRIYAAQAGAAARYAEATRRFTQGMLERVGRVATIAAVAVALLQAVATFAIAYAVAHRWDTGTLAATLLFSLATVTPALRLGHGLDYLAAGRAAAGRLATLLEEAPLPDGQASAPQGDRLPLVLEGLAVTQGARPLIAPLTHTFQPGTLTAITGPSGSGKSTLLRLLAGLEPASAGSLRLGPRAIGEIAERQRPHALLLIPQGADLLPATVRDNLALGARASDRDYLAALRRAQVDLDLDSDASRLSGGERQRVGLARAFLGEAPLLLLDEPTSALDPTTAARLFDELLKLAHEQGRTVLVVTHDTTLAARADHHLALASSGESA